MLEISSEMLETVCLVGKGAECCRYIVAGADGITCAKHTSLKLTIDARINKMTAKGDNCDGLKGGKSA